MILGRKSYVPTRVPDHAVVWQSATRSQTLLPNRRGKLAERGAQRIGCYAVTGRILDLLPTPKTLGPMGIWEMTHRIDLMDRLHVEGTHWRTNDRTRNDVDQRLDLTPKRELNGTIVLPTEYVGLGPSRGQTSWPQVRTVVFKFVPRKTTYRQVQRREIRTRRDRRERSGFGRECKHRIAADDRQATAKPTLASRLAERAENKLLYHHARSEHG